MTRFAKDRGAHCPNTIAPYQESLELTDATGSGADIVRVSVTKVEGESL